MDNLTKGIEHLGLTVRNVEESADFFIHLLGFRKIGEKKDYPAIFLTDGVVKLTLWALKQESDQRGFDRHSNVGLHHVALRVDEERLDAISESLSRSGVAIEFQPEFIGNGPSRHMMLSDPSGIRIELIARK